MEHQQSLHPEKKTEFLTLLADHHRRIVLSTLRNSADDVATVRELAIEVSDRGSVGEEQATVELRHSMIPRLVDSGLVEYDERSGTVRYQPHCGLDRLLDCVVDL
ncbi:DUF7344 domain-containing protein [Halomontanus rarus]|uniref:DUF7344 domain-containing protein n=1 Tax=Halomontanus rarus TaxID=3034020 RepID=UPI001A98CCA1